MEISKNEILLLSKLNCDHVIFSGDKSQHCDLNDNELERGAACNSCWVRRWAKGKLAANQDSPVNGEYVPYGAEWEKEMMRWTKKELVAELRRLLNERPVK